MQSYEQNRKRRKVRTNRFCNFAFICFQLDMYFSGLYFNHVFEVYQNQIKILANNLTSVWMKWIFCQTSRAPCQNIAARREYPAFVIWV